MTDAEPKDVTARNAPVDDVRAPGLVGDSSLLFASNIAVSAISFVGTAAVARTLAPTDWGGLTFLISLTSLVGFLFDFNVGRRVLEDAMQAGDRAPRVIGSFVGLRLAQGFTAYVAMVAFVAVGPYPGHVVGAAAILGTVQLFAAARTGLTLYFQLHLRFRAIALAAIVARLVTVALVFVLLAAGAKTLLWFVLPHVADAGLFMGLLWLVLRRDGSVVPSFTPKRWWPWIRESVLIALGSSIGIAYFRVDAVMLSIMDSLDAVAFYGIGYKFVDLLAYMPQAVCAPLAPLLVRAWPDFPQSFHRNVRGAFILLTTAGLGITAAFCLFAGPAIDLVFGHEYVRAAGAARLVAIGQTIQFVTALYVMVLIATNRHRIYPIASLAGLATNVALNLYLIPRHSYVGAAVATVFTEVVVLATLARAVRAIPGAEPVVWAPLRRAVLATAALVAAGLGVDLVAPWPVAALAAAIAFLATLHAVGIDGPGGLRVLRHLLQRVPDGALRDDPGVGATVDLSAPDRGPGDPAGDDPEPRDVVEAERR